MQASSKSSIDRLLLLLLDAILDIEAACKQKVFVHGPSSAFLFFLLYPYTIQVYSLIIHIQKRRTQRGPREGHCERDFIPASVSRVYLRLKWDTHDKREV